MSFKQSKSSGYAGITITQYHIEHPDTELTICGLDPLRWFDDIELYFDTCCTLEEAVSNPENYPEIERCDICWRDEEWRILKYLGD